MRVIRRRELTWLIGAAAAWPLAGRAQQMSALPKIGFLGPGTPSSEGQWYGAFVERLRELGWIEGRTVSLDHRWAEGRIERYAEIAAEFRCGGGGEFMVPPPQSRPLGAVRRSEER